MSSVARREMVLDSQNETATNGLRLDVGTNGAHDMAAISFENWRFLREVSATKQ